MSDEIVLIPHPYAGLTVRLKTREINVHEVKDGIVYYGMYDDIAVDCPHRCVGTYQKPEAEFIDGLGRAILDGAVTYSKLSNDD